MRRHSNGSSHTWWVAVATVLMLTVSGCTPTVQPNSIADPLGTGHVVDASETWQSILASATNGESTGRYMIKMNTDVSDSSLQSHMSVYGGINPPDRMSVEMVESNSDVLYYQQGQAAYYRDNGRWTETTPLEDVDVFPSYIRIIRRGAEQAAPIVQLKDTYVNNEFCKVYRTTLSASLLDTLPMLQGKVNTKDLQDIQYTFYVGIKDKMLRRVQTQSVGDVTGVGSLQVDSDTVLFDLGETIATVQLPKDLAKQLENSGN